MLSFYGYTSDVRTVWSPVAGTSLFTLTTPSEWQACVQSRWPHPHTRPCAVIKTLPCFLWVPSKLSFTSSVFTVFLEWLFTTVTFCFSFPQSLPFPSLVPLSWLHRLFFELFLTSNFKVSLIAIILWGSQRTHLLFPWLIFLEIDILKKVPFIVPPPLFLGGG